MLKRLDFSELMQTRRTLVLALAGGVLGVVASILAYVYLEREETKLRDKVHTEQTKDLVPVVVAKFPLAAGTAIGDNNMAIRQVPKDYVYPDTVLPGNFDKLQGQALIKPLAQGQPLLLSYLAEGGAAGLADKVKDGRRAVSINVDEVSSFNGLLMPGDRIDLMLSSRGNGGTMVVPLLQGVKVIATGSQYAPIQNAQPGGDKFGLRYATVTLDVTPEEAERVVLARDAGTLTAVLRGRGDDTAVAALAPLQTEQLFTHSLNLGDTVSYIMRGSQPGVATTIQVPVNLTLGSPTMAAPAKPPEPAPPAAPVPSAGGHNTKKQEQP